MKAVGVVRNLDKLGRLVVPKEIRKQLNIMEGDAVEFYVHDEAIILTKYQPGCAECETAGVKLYGLSRICKECLDKMTAQAENE